MSPNIGEQKAALRQKIRVELNQLSPAARHAASGQACSWLRRQQIWRDARSVLLFSPLPDEVDVGPILEEALAGGKELALPCFDSGLGVYRASRVLHLGEDLQPGKFGIREPKNGCPEMPLNQLDFILAPGVAFAWDGRRLGRGKGYYDRLLSSVCGLKCGIAFDEQIVDEIPTGPHDIRFDYILTPSRWLACGPGAVLK